MTRDFLSRGYTDPAKALKSKGDGRPYTLPRHEAIRALLVGDRQNYSEEYSSVLNPFDSRLSKTSSQLLRLYILAGLVKMSSVGSFRSLDGPVIFDVLESVGFPRDDVLRVLDDLCKFSCLSTLSHGKAQVSSSYYPTRLGGHIVKNMIGDLTFVENVMVDTFIPDSDVWKSMRTLSDSIRSEREHTKRLVKRVRRVSVFHEHMSNLYTELVNESVKRSLTHDWCSNPFDDAASSLKIHCEKAIRSSRRGSKNRNY